MENKNFVKDTLRISLLELQGSDFASSKDNILHRKVRIYMEDPKRRKKIEEFKKTMLQKRWNGGTSIKQFKKNNQLSPIIFTETGFLWEGGHRITALVELFLMGKNLKFEFFCILGWPANKTGYSLYVRSKESKIYRKNAVDKLIQNNFKDVYLPEP